MSTLKISNYSSFGSDQLLGDLMILEIDNINDDNTLIIYPRIDSRKNIKNQAYLNYKDNKLDTVEVRTKSAKLNPKLRIYSSDLRLLSYSYEEYDYSNLEETCKYECSLNYHKNGTLANYSEHIQIPKNDKDSNNYTIDKRQEILFSETGLSLSYKEHDFDELKCIDELEYDNDRIIHYKKTYLIKDKQYENNLEYIFGYNDDGYLIRRNVVEGNGIGEVAGDYSIYEYSEDYSIVNITNYYPNQNDIDSNIVKIAIK